MKFQPAAPEVTFVDREGTQLTVPAEVGTSVMQTAKCHGIPGIRAECGGFMMCGTCHVYVDPEQMDDLDPIGEMEEEMLQGVAAERRPTSRLACQLTLMPGSQLRVTLPSRQV